MANLPSLQELLLRKDRMMSNSVEDLAERLNRLEERNRQVRRIMVALWAFALLALLGFTNVAGLAEAGQTANPGVLTVRELIIVDDKNVPRVRVGASLPDAIIDGKRVSRGGEQVSGVMLYDATGQERGGYVTFEPSGNIGLTLDSRKAQTAMFIAGADGGSALQLWTRGSAIELRSDEDGSRLTATQGGNILAQLPAIATMTGGTCSAYKEALSRVSAQQAMSDCRRRFPAGACSKCLEGK